MMDKKINISCMLIIILALVYYLQLGNTENMNNCYSYALNRMGNYKKKPQPGKFSNITQIKGNENYKCAGFINRVLLDNKNARFISEPDYSSGRKCNKNETTVFLAIDNTGVSYDYHFYKKKPTDKYWTHKPGLNNIINFDSDGVKILDPLTANRDYEKDDIHNKHKWNYSRPCGYFCNNESLPQ